MMGLSFIHPEALILLAGLPILYLFYLSAAKKRKQAAMKFSSLGLVRKAAGNKGRWRQNILFYMNILLIVVLLVAIADPHIPLKQTKEGVNVVLAIDVSGSMTAEDYKPSRIEAAKLASKTLIEDLKTQDHVGIVIFESGATTAAYLTKLKERAMDKLSAVKAKQGKTAIGDGLALAVDMVTSIPNKKKLVILLSDGVNNAGVISPKESIGYAKDEDIQVYTVGLGSNGKTVIGYDWFGNPQYAELDEKLLQEIAKSTGGEYFKAVDDETLNEIYDSLSEKIKREKEDTSIKDWFLWLAVLILLAEMYIRYGKYRIIQ